MGCSKERYKAPNKAVLISMTRGASPFDWVNWTTKQKKKEQNGGGERQSSQQKGFKNIECRCDARVMKENIERRKKLGISFVGVKLSWQLTCQFTIAFWAFSQSDMDSAWGLLEKVINLLDFCSVLLVHILCLTHSFFSHRSFEGFFEKPSLRAFAFSASHHSQHELRRVREPSFNFQYVSANYLV